MCLNTCFEGLPREPKHSNWGIFQPWWFSASVQGDVDFVRYLARNVMNRQS